MGCDLKCCTVVKRQSQCAWTVESPSTEAKYSLNWSGKEENFSKLTRKGDKWTILLRLRGENQAVYLNFGEKMDSQYRAFETALSSLDFVYRKLQQTPQNPPKTMK